MPVAKKPRQQPQSHTAPVLWPESDPPPSWDCSKSTTRQIAFLEWNLRRLDEKFGKLTPRPSVPPKRKIGVWNDVVSRLVEPQGSLSFDDFLEQTLDARNGGRPAGSLNRNPKATPEEISQAKVCRDWLRTLWAAAGPEYNYRVKRGEANPPTAREIVLKRYSIAGITIPLKKFG